MPPSFFNHSVNQAKPVFCEVARNTRHVVLSPVVSTDWRALRFPDVCTPWWIQSVVATICHNQLMTMSWSSILRMYHGSFYRTSATCNLIEKLCVVHLKHFVYYHYLTCHHAILLINTTSWPTSWPTPIYFISAVQSNNTLLQLALARHHHILLICMPRQKK